MKDILAEAQRSVIEPFAWSQTLLAFDFDGTLAPIVHDPPKAAMRPLTRTLLARAAALYPCVVISGRALSDVAKRVKGLGLRGVVGNHGVEPWRATTQVHQRVQEWRPLFRAALEGEAGVEIEDKTYSLAIHFRRSRAKKRVKERVMRVAAGLEDVRVIGGIEVVNLVPADAPHKGIALERERARLRCDTAIYVGDDHTDEDVFALDQPGRLLTVRVGRSVASCADFYLGSQADIDAFLRILIGLRERQTRMGRLMPAAGQIPVTRLDPPIDLGPDLAFLRELWALDHVLQKRSKRMARSLGVTGPQRLALRLVSRFPGLPAGRLAGLLQLHPSTVTGVVKRLAGRGLLTRRSDDPDRRRSLLRITPAGLALLGKAEPTIESAVLEALRSLEAHEVETAIKALATVARGLGGGDE